MHERSFFYKKGWKYTCGTKQTEKWVFFAMKEMVIKNFNKSKESIVQALT